ncbi:MAG: hypothetical protein QF569_02450, partial [Candidatus Poribacteria bacterium]|nr:hypothetical protein [Candidatus Poribacteria bacterium]
MKASPRRWHLRLRSTISQHRRRHLKLCSTTTNSLGAAIDFINNQRSNLMSSIQNTGSSLSTIRDADFA